MSLKYIFIIVLINYLLSVNGNGNGNGNDNKNDNMCNENDLIGLKLLYDNMNGDYWKNNKDWLATNTSCCNWYGITCDNNNNNRVNIITLNSNNLTGDFPNFDNTLEFLSSLNLIDNSITGNLKELLNFKFLSVIDLGNNLIYDELPEQLFESTTITYINLQQNMIYGTIPEINCPLLSNLFLTINNLSGNFPTISSSNLHNIYMANNNLISIPDTFDATPNLQQLVLTNNNITGTIPRSLSNTNLNLLDISNNNFFGEIPKEFSTIKTLKEFYANNNKLTAGINNLIMAQVIEIVNNRFNETIKNRMLHGPLRILLASSNNFNGHLILQCSFGMNVIDVTNNNDLRAYKIQEDWCDIKIIEYPKYESDGCMCSNVMLNNCLILADGSFFDYEYCD